MNFVGTVVGSSAEIAAGSVGMEVETAVDWIEIDNPSFDFLRHKIFWIKEFFH